MISVIIPVYNGEKYLQFIISCFEKQTYKNFEIIFINDGSTDNSLKVLRGLKNESTLNINIISQKNKGVSSARNNGIENAKGEFICFCDVDDEVEESYLSDMHDVFNKNNKIDLVACKYNVKRVKDNKIINGHNSGTGEIVVKDSLSCLRDLLYGNIKMSCCNFMFKRSIIMENELSFANGYAYYEDLHMVWRLIACSRNIAYLDKYLYIYKLQDGSATSKFNNERLRGCELAESLVPFFEIHSPEFYKEYREYGVAKLKWTISWQAAANYNFDVFKKFCNNYHVKSEMIKLLTFKRNDVRLSALVLLFSLRLFQYLAIQYGRKYLH